MTGIAIGAIALVGGWFVARWVGRGKPCPVLVASLFDNRIATMLGGTNQLIERADVRVGMRVLDAGCGPGRISIPLAQRVGPSGEIVALDLQDGMLEMVRANTVRAGVTNVRTVLGALGSDSEALQEYADTFDRVMLVTVLGEIPNPQAAFQSLVRVLKPGGILSVTEMIIDPDYVPRARVRQLAQAAGFELESAAGSILLATSNFQRPKGESD